MAATTSSIVGSAKAGCDNTPPTKSKVSSPRTGESRRLRKWDEQVLSRQGNDAANARPELVYAGMHRFFPWPNWM